MQLSRGGISRDTLGDAVSIFLSVQAQRFLNGTPICDGAGGGGFTDDSFRRGSEARRTKEGAGGGGGASRAAQRGADYGDGLTFPQGRSSGQVPGWLVRNVQHVSASPGPPRPHGRTATSRRRRLWSNPSRRLVTYILRTGSWPLLDPRRRTALRAHELSTDAAQGMT